MPPKIVEAQQNPQNQQEALPGSSGEPRVVNPPPRGEQQPIQRGGGKGELGRVTRQNRRKSEAPKRFSNSG